MHHIILDDEIHDNLGKAIELNIPYSSKRVNFIITGENELVVIVEFKQ